MRRFSEILSLIPQRLVLKKGTSTRLASTVISTTLRLRPQAQLRTSSTMYSYTNLMADKTNRLLNPRTYRQG